MNKNIASTELDDLKRNYRANKDSLIEPNEVVIEINHLETFIAQARTKAGCDAIKIHFIRHLLNADQEHIKKITGKNLSQISLAFVPARITNRTDWTAADLKDGNNILTLLVCVPAVDRSDIDDKTGMCPPKGDCPTG